MGVYRLNVAGLSFLVGSYDSVTGLILSAIHKKEPQVILPASLNDLASLNGAPAVRKYYSSITFCTTDGMPLVLWSYLKVRKRIERVYGPDLLKTVILHTQKKNIRHFFYGSSGMTLSRLRSVLLGMAPKLTISEMISPPYKDLTERDAEACARKIIKTGSSIIWIGLSSPKQVSFAGMLRTRVPSITIICAGAAFDFVSGTKPQAPYWMQVMGLEWCFRLSKEPRRLGRRYLVDIPLFLIRKLVL